MRPLTVGTSRLSLSWKAAGTDSSGSRDTGRRMPFPENTKKEEERVEKVYEFTALHELSVDGDCRLPGVPVCEG
jgi:hypothetical protein